MTSIAGVGRSRARRHTRESGPIPADPHPFASDLSWTHFGHWKRNRAYCQCLHKLFACACSVVSHLSIHVRARHRPGPYARQDGGGVLTAPMSIRARSSCNVLDALRALPPVRRLEAALAHAGACWPHGTRCCCSGSWCVQPALKPMADGPHPVAVGRAEVLWIVVPGTAADDAARGGERASDRSGGSIARERRDDGRLHEAVRA